MTSVDNEKIVCRVDGAAVHIIQAHLTKHHPEWTIERYKEEFPGEPLLSEWVKAQIAARRAATKPSDEVVAAEFKTRMEPLAEVFGFSKNLSGVKNRNGDLINVTVFVNDTHNDLVPEPDNRYVFEVDMIKTVLMALELNMPIYLWGYHGTGKTTILEQACARTGRPFMRVQHTVNTEEAHILGQYIVKDGATQFQYGPLAIAMREGYVYCADEYDFAMPSVTSVYQPVLEGKALYIKDAPEHMRMIRPHKNFRFGATGNTNGGGDETGLYQGTQMQNAANYSRFAVVEEVPYMTAKVEAAVIMSQAMIPHDDAKKLVEIANKVRDEFKTGRIGSTISPRELINAAKIGILRADYKEGMRLGYCNRLSRVDKEVVGELVKLVFA